MEETAQAGLNMPTAVLTSVLFLSVAIVIIAFFAFRYRYQMKALDALQTALEQGSNITSDLAKVLEMRSDFRRGCISLARAAGCILFGVAIFIAQPEDAADAEATMWVLIGLSAFPGLFGLTLLGFHFSGSRQKR